VLSHEWFFLSFRFRILSSKRETHSHIPRVVKLVTKKRAPARSTARGP